MKKIIDINNIDYRKQPMFFGDFDLGIQRYDQPKYEKIFNMFKQQLSYFWRPEEINLSKDKSDFNNLSDHEKLVIWYSKDFDELRLRANYNYGCTIATFGSTKYFATNGLS